VGTGKSYSQAKILGGKGKNSKCQGRDVAERKGQHRVRKGRKGNFVQELPNRGKKREHGQSEWRLPGGTGREVTGAVRRKREKGKVRKIRTGEISRTREKKVFMENESSPSRRGGSFRGGKSWGRNVRTKKDQKAEKGDLDVKSVRGGKGEKCIGVCSGGGKLRPRGVSGVGNGGKVWRKPVRPGSGKGGRQAYVQQPTTHVVSEKKECFAENPRALSTEGGGGGVRKTRDREGPLYIQWKKVGEKKFEIMEDGGTRGVKKKLVLRGKEGKGGKSVDSACWR